MDIESHTNIRIDLDDWQITPKHMRSHFTLPLSIEQKIAVFYEQTDGWQLGIADRIINGVRDKNDEAIEPSQSAYAVLNIVFSFFEKIAKYQDGYIGKESKSRYYFKKGVTSIFPVAEKYPELLDLLYTDVRCGLYHSGFAEPRVFIRTDLEGAIAFTKSKRLFINPRILVRKLREYLKSYTERLQVADSVEARKRFEKRFNFDSELV